MSLDIYNSLVSESRNIVVFTGAGISTESGIPDFRSPTGIWTKNQPIEFKDFLSSEEIRVEFWKRKFAIDAAISQAKPNSGHMAISKLNEIGKVSKIITQNIDDLHEQAGSNSVLHIHGELKKVRSSINPNLIYDLKGWELKTEDKCEKGSQLRPHIVWFGEAVPKIEEAEEITAKADVLIIVGTSLNVYPAAGLSNAVKPGTKVYLVDPGEVETVGISNLSIIKSTATEGLPKLVDFLLKE